MNFVTEHRPSRERLSKCNGPVELHLTEPAVMLAVAQWLFDQRARDVEIHPDGMHLKQYDMLAWLREQRFERTSSRGKTDVGGTYTCGRQTIDVDLRPGIGDVVAKIDGKRVEVEAKGGCINTRHAGQLSKLRKNLYEAVGLLLDTKNDADRLIAAVPRCAETERVASRMAERCRRAGIEIALVSGDGAVEIVE